MRLYVSRNGTLDSTAGSVIRHRFAIVKQVASFAGYRVINEASMDFDNYKLLRKVLASEWLDHAEKPLKTSYSVGIASMLYETVRLLRPSVSIMGFL